MMIRTQVQLSEAQMKQLKDIAQKRGVSIAALIREGADLVIRAGGNINSDEKIQRALAVAGKFRSEHTDLSVEHDRYLAEDFDE